MSVHGGQTAYDEYFESAEHQAAFVFAPGNLEDVTARPAKRRKTSKGRSPITKRIGSLSTTTFAPLLGGTEPLECTQLRHRLFEECWRDTNSKIKTVLEEANEGTLEEVESYINSSAFSAQNHVTPAGFIVTGPNISSQELLFAQLSARLKNQGRGPTVLLRSGDASNLKNTLKQIIRDSTHQKDVADDEEVNIQDEYGRKFLNYDLEILHKYVNSHRCDRVVLILQDSEAFDGELLSEIVRLLSSWQDRIPFVLLFGIATSVALFYERLPRAASCCVNGTTFNVETTDLILDRIIKKTIANASSSVKLGSVMVEELLARQRDHVQSVQAFTMSLKYAFMCHYYGNALSLLVDIEQGISSLNTTHLDAIRTLPSFRAHIASLLDRKYASAARDLLDDDKVLVQTIKEHLSTGHVHNLDLLRTIHLLAAISAEPVNMVELYISALDGILHDTITFQKLLDSNNRKTPQETLAFLDQLQTVPGAGSKDMDLAPWKSDDMEALAQLQAIAREITELIEASKKSGDPLRSAHAIHSKGLRTTVIAQRVQLTHEKSSLSKQDQDFLAIIDKLHDILRGLFTIKPSKSLLFHEIWLYDSTSPYTETFTPRPRHAMESALSSPHGLLQCSCCVGTEESLSATQPATAILYQMCLQAGSLINIADLWSTFLDNQRQAEGEDNDDWNEEVDEREVLIRYYRGLSELKQMGIVKQSKKKVDHLAKVCWKGL